MPLVSGRSQQNLQRLQRMCDGRDVSIFGKIPAVEAEILPKMYFVFQVLCPIVTKSGPFEAHAYKVQCMIFHENPSNRRPDTADRRSQSRIINRRVRVGKRTGR